MPNKTENIKLNQWEAEDDFLRKDFNEDNAKLEAVLTGLQNEVAVCTRIVCGTYTGGYAKADSTHTAIELGFRPKAVFSMQSNGRWVAMDDAAYCGMTYDGASSAGPIAITDAGFEIWNNTGIYNYLNHSNVSYHYVAFV